MHLNRPNFQRELSGRRSSNIGHSSSDRSWGKKEFDLCCGRLLPRCSSRRARTASAFILPCLVSSKVFRGFTSPRELGHNHNSSSSPCSPLFIPSILSTFAFHHFPPTPLFLPPSPLFFLPRFTAFLFPSCLNLFDLSSLNLFDLSSLIHPPVFSLLPFSLRTITVFLSFYLSLSLLIFASISLVYLSFSLSVGLFSVSVFFSLRLFFVNFSL